MRLRRCLSIGLAAMLLGCGIGVSGLESVALKPSMQGGQAEPPIRDDASSDPAGQILGGDSADAAAPPHGGGGASSVEAGVTNRNTGANPADGAAADEGPLADAEVVDLVTTGCPDLAACPAGYVCCAQFQDGGVIPAFGDAGAIETSCQPSCKAGTTPLCASNADCGDAGACIKASTTSSRGFCAPTSPFFPTGGH